MRMHRVESLLLLVATTVTLSACRATGPSQEDQAKSLLKDTDTPLAPRLCAAFRGNGPYIWAHFAALSRVIEHYGLVEAVSGGSSGSITSFLYESMYANPLLSDCDGETCSSEESSARASLWLKSIQGYVEYLGDTEEAVAVKQLVPIFERAKANGIDTLMATDVEKGRQALVKLFDSKDFAEIIDQEAVDLITTSPNPEFHAKDMWAGISSLGAWKTDTNLLLFRPGVIDFKRLARKIGRIGNFYAGYGPYDKVAASAFVKSCALPSVGKTWEQIKGLNGPGGSPCGRMFRDMLHAYRKTLLSNEAAYASRIDERVGKYLPMLIPTALVEGAEAVAEYEAARQRYLAGQPVDYHPTFDRVKIGYWGRSEDLARVAANPRGFTDLKTAKFVALGDKPWTEALSFSPAEPGLTRLQTMSQARLSASGWFELHPSLALLNMGCQNVVYVTNRGDEGEYPRGVAKHLGMTPAEEKAIYDLDSPQSSLSLSVAASQGVWCSNWGASKPTEVAAIFGSAYAAPFEVRAPFFSASSNPYAHAKASVGIRGCTPGTPP